MKSILAVGIGLALGFAVLTAGAATKPPAQKAAPACAAIVFRPVPSGMTDGEQQAGVYKSRHARLELRAVVKQGEPVDYFVVAGGKHLVAAPASLPETAASCAAAKKMPAPGTPASSCTGQRFTVVIAHAGNERFALLYGLDGSTWRFCTAGTF
ncbi:MAG TPA: hypothetical protein VKG22_07290 [Stellaceae bacterium]|nr:hypothetical protein [Stellaceae bacterium]HMD66436.1 hypothetical protein [Stellaceae bacterium]